MKKITIFTPTYNRAHTLNNLYKSLINQKCKDFIWMIVDDGSTDNTKEIVKKFKSEKTRFKQKRRKYRKIKRTI